MGTTDLPRALGIDYGRARIGLAIADDLGLMAHPRPFVAAKPPQKALRQIVSLAKAEEVKLFLVGLPRNMDGTEGMSARRVRAFAETLAEASLLPVEFIDERLSTVEAQARLHEAGQTTKTSRSSIDSASAAILLQAWLDAKRDQRGL